MGYRMVMFHATDVNGRPIYHTNVLMAVGTTVAVLCTESIEDPVIYYITSVVINFIVILDIHVLYAFSFLVIG